jgi:nucleotide-binding universal stress UspA family protein
LDRAEEIGGEDALKEALDTLQALGLRGNTRLERGRPDQVIVEVARRVNADLISIQARERAGHPRQGSVGHTARSILDHAPCDVLLLRNGNGK